MEVAELVPERRRARLKCTCSVAGEIVLDGDAVASRTVLADLAPAVSVLPVTGKCTALGDAELPIPTDG